MKIGITNREVVNAFRTLVGDKAQLSDDNGWSSRLVYFYLLRYRARLIREKYYKSRPLSHWNYQTIDCIKLEKANASECPCAPAPGCSFKKIVTPIPKPLNRLKSVTSVDGQITYTFVEWERLKSKINSRIPAQAKMAYYTIKTRNDGSYLYLYNNIHRKELTVTGIFENPLEIQYYPDCKGSIPSCRVPLDQEFILDPDLMPTVYDMAFAQINKVAQLGTDILNDDMDNITTTQNNVK